jgi:uncharacterized protein (DUF4415 family)
VEFVWDAKKSRLNKRKHGIGFETAIMVFDDPYHISVQDREVDRKIRWQTIGMAGGSRFWLLATRSMRKRRRFESSQREKQPAANGISMPKANSKRRITRTGPERTVKQRRELAVIASMNADQIDTSDLPELPPAAWNDAGRGRFYRPVKQAVSMRLDADVVAWLKKPGKGYQTRANQILRQHMLHDLRRA